MRPQLLRLGWLPLTSLVVLAACTESTSPPAATLTFSVQPSNATGGVAISPPVAVAIEDESGNVVETATDVVTVALGADPGGGTLSGTTAVHAVNGVATFSALGIDKIGTGYTLRAAAPGRAGATSVAFDVAVGPATRLAFTVQPTNTNAGATITPAVQVAVQDAGGNTVTAFTGNVTIAIGSNPASGTLAGTSTVLAVAGVATFSDLSIDNAASGYALKATSGTMAGSTSAPFAIAPALPSLHVTTTTSGAYVPNGYSLCIDPGYYTPGCYARTAIGVNSAVTLLVEPGTHVVQLDVALNCAVSGDDPRTVTASDGVTEVPFAVTCAAPGSVHVTTATTGTDIDPDGYRVCVDRSGNPCYWSTHANANDAVTIAGVASGSHTVSVEDVAANCTGGGGAARAVTVPAGGEVSVAFDVGCVALGTAAALHVTTTTTGAYVPPGYVLCIDPGYYTPGCYARSTIGANSAVTVPVELGTHVVQLDVASNCAVSGDDPRTVRASGGTTEVAFAVTCAAPGSVHVTTAAGDEPAWRPHR